MELNRIKEVITENKSTGTALAEYLGYRDSTISNWCRNATQPSMQDLHSIAKFFHVDIRDLLVSTTWPNTPSPASIVRQEKIQAKAAAKKKATRKRKK